MERHRLGHAGSPVRDVAPRRLPIDHTTKVTAAWQWLAERSPSLVLEAVNAMILSSISSVKTTTVRE